MGELEATLKWLKKDKSPSPDGWSIEFYLDFFDVIGNDLLKVIEDCRKFGCMHRAINTTFIALIPKFENHSSDNGFRPISLCNFLYKIISKIIANHICPILSAHISLEQFYFLKDRQIHEAISSTQEVLHSIQSKKIKGMILKVDLSKSFDNVRWLYLRMLLTHLGFPVGFIKWIMCCITNISFSALINGAYLTLLWL